MLIHSWVILGDMFRPLNGHPQANLEQWCEGTVKIVIQWDPIVYIKTLYFVEFIVLKKIYRTVWPEDGRLTAGTCRQE